MLDGKTGIPRTIINIEKAALLTAEERPSAPRLRKYRERCGNAGTSHEEEGELRMRAKG